MQFSTSDAIDCWNECAELHQQERKWTHGLNPDRDGRLRLRGRRDAILGRLAAIGAGVLAVISFRDATGYHFYAVFVAHEEDIFSPGQSLRVFFSFCANVMKQPTRTLDRHMRELLEESPPLADINTQLRAVCEDVATRLGSLRCVVADVSELRTSEKCFVFRPQKHFGMGGAIASVFLDNKRMELAVLPTQADAENLVETLRDNIEAGGMPRNTVPFHIFEVRYARAPLFWTTSHADVREMSCLRTLFFGWASTLKLKQEEEDRVLGPRQP
jgi:hypothetical protein